MGSKMAKIEKEKSQFALFGTKRFAPFFVTQFLGAFNDNVFKNVLIILIAYTFASRDASGANTLINIAAGLFILPFFLFSALAGQIADKYEKSMLIKRIKFMEIVIMTGGSVAFYLQHVYLLLFFLFLMGAQSSFFGPLKYSIIPQHLKSSEIVGGNAMVEMGTFVAILLGTMAGGILGQVTHGMMVAGGAVITIALIGWGASLFIPPAFPLRPEMALNRNLFTQTIRTINYGRKVRSVFFSILAISWFWFLGLAYLTQLPIYTKEILKGSESVLTLLLTMFSIGIGIGSLLCERMSGKKVELGLVPLGSLGLTFFGIDLFFAYHPPEGNLLMGIAEFVRMPGGLRVLADLILVGVFGGFYSVPLLAYIQVRTPPEYRARVIAANNILNALFMVAATITGVMLIGIMKLTIPQFFLAAAIMNICVTGLIFRAVPDFLIRFVIWLVTHGLYRVRYTGLEKIPDKGAALLVCNCAGHADALIIAGSVGRPVRFVVPEPVYGKSVLNYIFRNSDAIPISSKNSEDRMYSAASESISQCLRNGELVCIFTNGRFSGEGLGGAFDTDIEEIVRHDPVPVIPLALKGLWGNGFGGQSGRAMMKLPSRLWARVELKTDTPLAPDGVTADGVHRKLRRLIDTP